MRFLAAVTLLLVNVGISQADPMAPALPGLFYVFASGQIVVINPATHTVVKSIRTFNDSTAAVFPNSCTGNPYQGTWNGVALGTNQQTIFATASFSLQGSLRLPGLKDVVIVLNTTSQEVDAIIPVGGVPTTVRPVYEDGSVWVHSNSDGSFSVLSISPSFEVEQLALGTSLAPGGGTLITDSAMGTKAYMTSTGAPGVYVYDVYGKSTDVPFVSFPTFMAKKHPWDTPVRVKCPATSQGVFSRINRRAYIGCVRATTATGSPDTRGPEPGIVELSVDDDKPQYYYNFRADKLYLTPDESLVLAVDARNATINIIQPQAGLYSAETFSEPWRPIHLPPGSHPDSLVFALKDRFYVAYVSLLNSADTAVIDFNVLIPCGWQCSDNVTASAVTYFESGVHVPPGKTSTTVLTRPIAFGDHYVCVAAAKTSSLYCLNLKNGAKSKTYYNMAGIQQITFAEGKFWGNETLIPDQTALHGINTVFSCTSS